MRDAGVGATYRPALDRARLAALDDVILGALAPGRALTLEELQRVAGRGSQTGISAGLRRLRARGYVIHSGRRGDPAAGVWQYRLAGGPPHGRER